MKKIVSLIIGIILIYLPTQSLAWLQYSVYEKSNIITAIISIIMKILAFLICIGYITNLIRKIKNSNEEKCTVIIKNQIIWIIIAIVEIVFFIFGSIWVKNIGMETYWTSGERFQFNEIDMYISNGIRIIAFVVMIIYIIFSSIYFIKSKQENIQKVGNIIKVQVIISAIIAGLLVFATRW